MIDPAFFDHWLWKESRRFSRIEALLDCWRAAQSVARTHRVKGREIDVPPGGFIASQRGLAARWRWSRKQVEWFLKGLEKSHELRREMRHGVQVLIFVACEPGTDGNAKKGAL